MYFSFAPGLLGINTDFQGSLEMAARHGFEGVDTTATQLAALDETKVAAIGQKMADLKLHPGYFGLDPVVISAPEDVWQSGVELLRQAAPIAQKLGYTRSIAVVLPFSETLDFDQNTAFHLERFAQILPILAESGISLGIEYVAPLTRRAPYQHHFIHNLRGALELIEASKSPNLGLLLDSFHWFCADESTEQIAALSPSQIVAVHLNDAIAGRPRDEQVAFERELPGDSGEIDLTGFVAALKKAGYDGPLTCEPMNKTLNELDDDATAQRTLIALRSVPL